jgi:hypothetical protein
MSTVDRRSRLLYQQRQAVAGPHHRVDRVPAEPRRPVPRGRGDLRRGESGQRQGAAGALSAQVGEQGRAGLVVAGGAEQQHVRGGEPTRQASASRRLFPIPASPVTSNEPTCPAPAAWRARSTASSSTVRPTSAVTTPESDIRTIVRLQPQHPQDRPPDHGWSVSSVAPVGWARRLPHAEHTHTSGTLQPSITSDRNSCSQSGQRRSSTGIGSAQ